ncbi:MAG: nickel-dependent hydrogenase large subunit [bacterium]|nr:nickel-dependent hydrogenase large subunit [bacterium]
MKKIAIFDLSGCDGCELSFLNLKERLLELYQDFEIANWRLLQKNTKDSFDIAFVEGGVTNEKEIAEVKKIRSAARTVVSFGNCAVNGNIFAEFNDGRRRKEMAIVYGKKYKALSGFFRPIEDFIKVDAKIFGCPPDFNALEKILKMTKIAKTDSLDEAPRAEPVVSSNASSSEIRRSITPLRQGFVGYPSSRSSTGIGPWSSAKADKPPSFSSDYLAKIEGHGVLKINFNEEKASFVVEESERLVERLVVGKHYSEVPFIVSRICGICPTAHNLCSILAIENGLGIEVKDDVTLLRRLALANQIIQSHLLHLFFMVLPDFARVESGLEIARQYPSEFRIMLSIKRASDEILTLVGGRPIHPTNTKVGGFIKLPEEESLAVAKEKILESLDEAEDLVKLFAGFTYLTLNVKERFMALSDDNGYPLAAEKIVFGKKSFTTLDYHQFLKEEVVHPSSAKEAFLENSRVRVGAVARLSF